MTEVKLQHEYVDGKIVGLTDEMREKRNEIAKTILSCLKENDFVFGGFVRDKIAGKDWGDIDLCITGGARGLGAFKRKLRDLIELSSFLDRSSFSLTRVYGSFYDKQDSANRDKHHKYALSIGGVSITFDVIIERSDTCIAKAHTCFVNKDVDINGLYQHPTGKIGHLHLGDPEVESVINNIKKGVYKKFDTCFDYRVDKLTAKGYKDILSVPASTSVPATQPVNKEEKKMTAAANTSWKAFAAKAIEEGKYAAAAKQTTKGIKGLAKMALSSMNASPEVLASLNTILESEFGDGLAAAIVAVSIKASGSTDARVVKLSEKCAERGVAQGLNQVASLLEAFVMPMILGAVNEHLPSVSLETKAEEPAKLRVEPPAIPALHDDEDLSIDASAFSVFPGMKAAKLIVPTMQLRY